MEVVVEREMCRDCGAQFQVADVYLREDRLWTARISECPQCKRWLVHFLRCDLGLMVFGVDERGEWHLIKGKPSEIADMINQAVREAWHV